MVEMAVKRRLILIVAEDCPYCEQAKQAVENLRALRFRKSIFS